MDPVGTKSRKKVITLNPGSDAGNRPIARNKVLSEVAAIGVLAVATWLFAGANMVSPRAQAQFDAAVVAMNATPLHAVAARDQTPATPPEEIPSKRQTQTDVHVAATAEQSER